MHFPCALTPKKRISIIRLVIVGNPPARYFVDSIESHRRVTREASSRDALREEKRGRKKEKERQKVRETVERNLATNVVLVS